MDRDKDIQALLGRSEHKSINFIKENIKKVKNGEMTHLAAVTTFDNDTLPMLYKSIEGKMQKDYGKSVMLVIRDTSPLDWDYTPYLEDIRETIDKSFSTHHKVFEKGTWLLNTTLNKIYKLT